MHWCAAAVTEPVLRRDSISWHGFRSGDSSLLHSRAASKVAASVFFLAYCRRYLTWRRQASLPLSQGPTTVVGWQMRCRDHPDREVFHFHEWADVLMAGVFLMVRLH